MAPKTEEQNFLERLGVVEATPTHDSDFNVELVPADEFAEERARLDALEYELNTKAERLLARDDVITEEARQNKIEQKRLKKWENELSEFEAELDEREMNQSVKDDGVEKEFTLDTGAMDEYRKQKKIERLKKSREDATSAADEVRSVWSTGWNT